ncbi:general transcription factor II-I repeat domain-containing protein 2A-like [Aphis gossypii]|uniref:general transcription factor II-I repeat domain-containing protein 2A-like n=1 Tax=Aphis gossypii TaxID=80765 RepID=UPI00215929E2|nr:general transcription factor II-I repeat domain-containing protein 2A-like [Aphis gossypii]
MISLKGRTRGLDIFNSFKERVTLMKLPLFKLVSITSDGAVAMTGRNNGFIALCKKYDDFPDFLSYHCIIHQQVLASKRLNTKDVMDTTFKIVNSIQGKPLQRRLFKMQNENKEVDLILHTDVGWLSRSRFLQRFRDLLDDIVQFLEDRGDSFPQIRDVNWLCDLAFLADFTGHLSDLNLKLQGKNIIIIDLISCISAFKANALILIRDLEKKNVQRFSNLEDHTRKYPNVVFDSKNYVIKIKAVIDDFDVRFNDFKKPEDVIPFISFPFKEDLNTQMTAKKAAQLFQIDEVSCNVTAFFAVILSMS